MTIKDQYYIYGLLLIYFILSVFGIINHEIWIDEAHHWLIARDSVSLMDLINNTRHEGHPILWNILLYIISRLTLNPFYMQLLHIIISTITVFVFLKKAPFSILFKGLFIFGYFMFYEYNIISRNYILGVLFIFLFISNFKDRKEKFTLLCFYLFLAMNTHSVFGIISFALFLTLLFESYYYTKTLKKKLLSYGSLIFVIGLLLIFIQIIPPEDAWFYDHIKKRAISQRLSFGFTSFYKALFPIPDFRTIHFWNSNLIANLYRPLAGILSLFVYIIPFFIFYRKKISLFFIYVALLGSQVFFFIIDLTAARYCGITFIIFIIALWIDKSYYAEETSVNKKEDKFKSLIVYSLITIQFIAGVISFSLDIKHPFSNGKEIALFLKEKKIDNHMIVAPFCQGTYISPYLKKKVYSLCDDKLHSFCNWSSYFGCDQSKSSQIEMLSSLNISNKIVFISNIDIIETESLDVWHKLNDQLSIKKVAKFDNYVIRDQDNIIYELKNNYYED